MVEDGRRDGADPLVLFADRERIAAGLDDVELLVQCRALGDRAVGEGGQDAGLYQGTALSRRQMRGDGLSQGGGMQGRAAAHAVGDAHWTRGLALVDVEDLTRVEDAQPHRLAREVAQAHHLRLGRAAQVELVPHPVGQLEGARA